LHCDPFPAQPILPGPGKLLRRFYDKFASIGTDPGLVAAPRRLRKALAEAELSGYTSALRWHAGAATIDPTDALTEIGLLDDEAIALGDAALVLASLDHPGADLAPYYRLIAEMTERLVAAGQEARRPADQAAALAAVLGVQYGFIGDAETYDDPANADLIRVIDRRRGLPVALAILYVATARGAGWMVEALNTPAHVLLHVGSNPAVIVDPFAGGTVVEANAVGMLLARAGGMPHPPRTEPFESLSNRGVLLRLLANQAQRARANGQAERALTLSRRMTALSPTTTALWWERAALERQLGNIDEARASLWALLETTHDARIRAHVLAAMPD
jgi:regulator of sirC expression with transglutaminase-like and TPR domain